MSTPTTNMALGKAVDTDNAKTYLETTLGAALDTIDAHDHSTNAKGLAVGRGNAMTVTNGLTVSTGGLIVTNGGLQVTAGNVSLGGTTNSSVGLFLENALTVNAASGAAYGILNDPTLVAQVNGDVLNGLYINPVFNDNTKTGVVHNSLKVPAGNVDFTGATVIANLPSYTLADVTIGLSSAVWTDCEQSTVTVPAGTYLCVLNCPIATGINSPSTMGVQLADNSAGSGGTPNFFAAMISSSVPAGTTVYASSSRIVTFGSSTTLKLQGYSNVSGSQTVVGGYCTLVRIA